MVLTRGQSGVAVDGVGMDGVEEVEEVEEMVVLSPMADKRGVILSSNEEEDWNWDWGGNEGEVEGAAKEGMVCVLLDW